MYRDLFSGDGGAIYNRSGWLSIENTTFVGNTVMAGRGAAIANEEGVVELFNCTLVRNRTGLSHGGGVLHSDVTTFTMANSILHTDMRSDLSPTACSPLISGGYNLIYPSLEVCPLMGDVSTDRASDPLLTIFEGDYGGPTWTMGLLPGSPAIDAGNPDGCQDAGGGTLATDQRGEPRPLDCVGGPRCDIGAFEGCLDAEHPILFWDFDPVHIGYPSGAVGDSPFEHWDLPGAFTCTFGSSSRYYELRDSSGTSLPIFMVRGRSVPGTDGCPSMSQVFVQF